MSGPADRRSSGLLLLALAGAVIAVLAAFAPSQLAGPFATAAVFAWFVALPLAVAWRTASALLPEAEGSVFLLAVGLLALVVPGVFVVATGVGGAFGLVAIGGLGALVSLFVHMQAPPARAWRSLLPTARFDAATAAGALLLAAAWLFVAGNCLRFTVQDADSMWYHLVMPAEWVRTGSIAISDAVPDLARGYPGFRQAVLAWLSLPAGNEHLALLTVFEFPLLVVAVYTLARSFGGTRPVAFAGALAAATTPVALGATTTQGNDLLLAIVVVAAVVFCRRHFAQRRAGDGLLAGVALGAVMAMKFSGPGYALLIVAATASVHWRAVFAARTLGLLAVGPLLLAAPWYLRNVLALGNPLWPAQVKVAGSVVFDGPIEAAWFAERTLGWNLRPLLERLPQFVEAHGVSAPLIATAPVLLLIAALMRRLPWRTAVVGAVLPLLLFATFLQHPFNQPSFDAQYSHRYLLAWASVGFAAAAAALGALLPPRASWLVVVAFAGAAAHPLAPMTRLAWPAFVAAAVGGAALAVAAWRRRLLEAGGSVLRAAPPRAAAAIAGLSLVIGALLVADARQRWQYDEALGWRDGRSERGWAGCVSYVHREVAGKRVGLHGSHFLFPLLGEPWRNVVRLADQPLVPGTTKSVAEVAAWCEAEALDVLVCCQDRAARTGSRAFEFVPSIAPALLAAHPGRFTVVYESRGAFVLTVRR
jgi:hypothetical protein